MKKSISISVIASSILLSACHVVYAPKGIKNVSAQDVIHHNALVYVAIGPDGDYRTMLTNAGATAENSGQNAARVLFDSMERYQPRIVMGTAEETEKEALASAHSKGMQYMAYLRVVDWQDTNYFTCGDQYATKVSVDVSLYDVAAGKAVRIDNLYNGGCPVKLLGIPLGSFKAKSRFEDVLSIWLAENLRDKR